MNLPPRFKDATLQKKLIYLAAVATLGGTLVAMAVLIVLQWYLQRSELAKVVEAQATIVAANSATPLLFNDVQAAEKMLTAFSTIKNIEFAGLMDGRGGNFAAYVRPGAVIPPHMHFFEKSVEILSDWSYVEVVIPIEANGERIGLIHVRTDLSPVYARLMLSMKVTFFASLFALLGAILTLKRLLPAISDPLTALLGLMDRVSLERNYTLRAEVNSRDEVGKLALGFNNMLEQIRQRDIEVAKHRDRLEDEVAKRTASLTIAQRIAHLGNWEWDVGANKLIWSDEIFRIFGLPPQHFQASYHAFLASVHPDDRASVEACVRNSMELGLPYSLDHRIVLPDGEVRYVHEQAEVLRSDHGHAIKMRGTVHDITERKLAEQKIRELNENLEMKVEQRTQQLLAAQDELVRREKLAVLGQVAGSVGHELRNPLGVMSNAVYFLQTVLSDADDTTKEYLNIIKSEIAVSDRIVSDLLDAVRIKPPQTEIVGVAELVEQTLRKCDVPETVAVEINIEPALPPLHVDGLQIYQVLRNLISNGVEAMTEGRGHLEIRATANRQDKTVTIAVKDDGCGIDPDQMGRLFQPLTTTKARGIGLGLVVVKNLTEANGGKVEVQSWPGRGTVFSVTLPAT